MLHDIDRSERGHGSRDQRSNDDLSNEVNWRRDRVVGEGLFGRLTRVVRRVPRTVPVAPPDFRRQ